MNNDKFDLMVFAKGRRLELNVSCDYTVYDVKQMLKYELGIQNMSLYSSGKEMRPDSVKI